MDLENGTQGAPGTEGGTTPPAGGTVTEGTGQGTQNTGAEGTPPAGGQPAGGAGDGGVPADWRTGLPDGWADKLKDVQTSEDALKALERGLGYKPAEKPEDITLKYPDSFKGSVDEGVEQNFREFCVQNGMKPGAAASRRTGPRHSRPSLPWTSAWAASCPHLLLGATWRMTQRLSGPSTRLANCFLKTRWLAVAQAPVLPGKALKTHTRTCSRGRQ